MITKHSVDHVWKDVLHGLLTTGRTVSPRSFPTLELPAVTVTIDARRPVLRLPSRKLNYRFMAAEAYWILTGGYRVEEIGPYCKKIADFSDDGKTFFGAYGPRIASQINYVVDRLTDDEDTRQAGLTIWRENPPKTRDVPCTVAIFFEIRNGFLETFVTMRSSDVWLGLPYDLFNFSMLAHFVCARLNKERSAADYVVPGNVYLTAASLHLYSRNVEAAKECVADSTTIYHSDMTDMTPPYYYMNEVQLLYALKEIRTSKVGSSFRFWEFEDNDESV